jgi:hypothetical protein
MTRRALLAGLLLAGAGGAAPAQTFTPQSPAGLSLTFTAERAGGSRVLIFGEVRNTTANAAERVTVRAEGLDENGRVVSRARAWVSGAVPPRGSAPFEVRLSASGTERRFRVEIEAFEFVPPGRRQPESP